jgi:hypothetical protein
MPFLVVSDGSHPKSIFSDAVFLKKRGHNGYKNGYSGQKEGQPPRADLLASY